MVNKNIKKVSFATSSNRQKRSFNFFFFNQKSCLFIDQYRLLILIFPRLPFWVHAVFGNVKFIWSFSFDWFLQY